MISIKRLLNGGAFHINALAYIVSDMDQQSAFNEIGVAAKNIEGDTIVAATGFFDSLIVKNIVFVDILAHKLFKEGNSLGALIAVFKTEGNAGLGFAVAVFGLNGLLSIHGLQGSDGGGSAHGHHHGIGASLAGADQNRQRHQGKNRLFYTEYFLTQNKSVLTLFLISDPQRPICLC